MAHPFHASIQRCRAAAQPAQGDRRGFLTVLIAGASAAAALVAARPAMAQRGRTRFNRGQFGVTTQALGEEGGSRPQYMTKAMGEEGGRYTTYATGEEGGGSVTTYALGEEGGTYYRPAPPRPSGGTVTTFAIGEEG
jgi:hypothetical protein